MDLSPPGWKKVYNRLNKDFEKFFDGRAFPFKAHETQLLPEDIANFMDRTSLVLFDTATGESVRALVLETDPDFEKPHDGDLGPELLVRTTNDNYIGRGTDGVKTQAKVIPVRGGVTKGTVGSRV